jgi:aspartate racemase
MWLLDQLTPGVSSYNVPRIFRIRGPLHIGALRRALNDIVARHEVLRTTYRIQDGSPVQVRGEAAVELPVTDLSSWPGEQREAEVQRLILDASDRGFDLTRDLLLRNALVRLDEEEHVLILVSHHIASDGWSKGILFRELAALYDAFRQGKPSPLPAPALQYADFAAWQRDWLQGEVLDRLLSYWKEQLDGAPASLELPTDHPRPPIQSGRGARRGTCYPKALLEALKGLNRQEGTTLFMLGLAAFKALLFRYTEQETIVVGTPISGRTRTEIEGLIGYFSNSLVLRTDLSGDLTFRELLRRVREVALGAYSHQEMPFGKLVVELNPPRDRSRSPLYQVMFSVGNAQMEELALPGLDVTALMVDRGTAKFDLTLGLREVAEGLLAGVEYSTDLFEPATIDRLLGHYCTLLEGIAADPDRPLAKLPLLTEGERHQLLIEWAGPRRDYPLGRCLHQLFEDQVSRTPEAVAVVSGGSSFTYRVLNERANRLAGLLREAGIGRGDFVAILHERGADFLTGMLAVFKSGAAYVPVDPNYPADRVRHLLTNSEAQALLTRSAMVGQYADLLTDCPRLSSIVCFDDLAQDSSFGARPAGPAVYEGTDIAAFPAGDLPNVNAPTDPLYMIFTSGSTGLPKGAVIRHEGAINHIYAQFDALEFTERVAFLQSAPSSSDISVWQFLAPVLIGGKVVVLDDAGLLDAHRLFTTIQENRVTIIEMVPALLKLLMDHVSGLPHECWCLPDLRWMMVTGEAAPVALVNAWFDLFPAAKVVNAYGPTEASDDVAQMVLAGPLPETRSTVPIGRPLANLNILIVNGQMELAPVGVPGEICVSGVGVGVGYWKDDEKTRAHFVPNPFSGTYGGVIYRTGDRGRWLPDGTLEFLGRFDHQDKIRGFRIELGEVEVALQSLPQVSEVVAVVREDRPGAKQLVAYLVPRGGWTPAAGELRRLLREHLPEYMVPTAFVVLESLPLTPNGKVNRRALPQPDRGRAEPDGSRVAPSTKEEEELVRIWEKLLAVQPISIRDNFFDLGGHSLLAVRLFAKVEKTFGKKLHASQLFQNPTIEQLAALLRQDTPLDFSSSLVAIQSGGSKRPMFFVHAGNGSWVLFYRHLAREFGPDQPFYALQQPAVDGRSNPLIRVEDMAAHYVKVIREVQPEGPYLLGGYCSGGVVAFAMAQQLRAEGQEVGMLSLVDTRRIVRRGLRHSLKRGLERSVYHLGVALRLPIRRKLSYLSQKTSVAKQRLLLKLRLKVNSLARRFYAAIGAPFPQAIGKVGEATMHAVRSYKPNIYPGKVDLYIANDPPVKSDLDPRLGWSELAGGGVEIHLIPAGHLEIVNPPHVSLLADKMRACLEKIGQ